MSGMKFREVFVIGDDVNTDEMIPAKYLNTSDPEELKDHAFEDIDHERFGNYEGQSVVVAGKNCGCGSSREHAPWAIAAAGVEVILATSFARIFYRNCVNGGAPMALQTDQDLSGIVKTGDCVSIDPEKGVLTHYPEGCGAEGGVEYKLVPYSGIAQEISQAGGLLKHLEKHGPPKIP